VSVPERRLQSQSLLIFPIKHKESPMKTKMLFPLLMSSALLWVAVTAQAQI
jgi:hypothetical protein